METPRVLLVDDQNSILSALKRVLRPDGYEVFTAASGEEALSVMAAQPIDVVLSDYNMPGITGVDLLLQIAREYPRVGRLMLSGQADLSQVIDAMNQGAVSRFLTKPWSNDVVRATIRDAIEKSRRDEEEADTLLCLPTKELLINQIANFAPAEGTRYVVAAEIVNVTQSLSLLSVKELRRIGNDLVARLKSLVRLETSAVSLERAIVGFVILSTDIDKDAAALVARLREPFGIGSGRVPLKFRFGVAPIEHEESDDHTSVRKALLALAAMNEADSRQVSMYTRGLTANLHLKYTLEQDLHRALKRHEFHCEYQPQVSGVDFRVRGAEALIRWKHPIHGLISPLEFIDMAERSGVIHDLGAWVIETGAAECRALADAGMPIRIAVNVSPRQFLESDLVGDLRRVVDAHRLQPHQFEIEITESSVMHDIELAKRVLSEVREMGVHVALDDFGTGYSSLAQLAQMPLDVLKIDRSFIRFLGEDATSLTLFKYITGLARELNLEIVAEGVETLAQAEICREYGCDLLQGYYFHKPLSRDALYEVICGEHSAGRH
ncbi:MAG: EAL domain-containing protein [Pseudomonadales bacterium]